MNLEQKLQNLPVSSGVYQYFDKDGKLLYIGKAKNLKNRVKSYFNFTPSLRPNKNLSLRISNMISKAVNLEYIVVDSENDALILENSLIKQLKPKYNILLRDDKTYPYIYVDFDETFPRLEITRKVINKKNIKYFGPFSSSVYEMLDSIYEVVPLVQSKSCLKAKKLCLFYQIKKCLGPCENKVTKDEYKLILDQAINLLKNRKELITMLESKMFVLSEELRFEEAKEFRDKITSIKKNEIKSTIDLVTLENLDIWAIANSEQKAIIVKIFVRDGRIVSSDYDILNFNNGFDEEEAYKRALINYYSNSLDISPKEVLLYSDFDFADLSVFVAQKFISPKIGKKRDLVNLAYKNALEILNKQVVSSNDIIKKQLKELCNLSSIPNRIEAFDNSHMMQVAKVGAMIVYENNKFIKKDYRQYNLDSGDEYSQMTEMLTRRVSSFEKNSPPDLWVIDGGKALLDLAKDIISSVGANVDVIAIAKEKVDKKANRSKGRAKDLIYFDDEILRLDTSDKRLHFVQNIRDEVHNSAINFHRKQKVKEDKKISLLSVKGIGEAKLKKLVNYFGSFENIKNSNIEELSKVLNKTDASNIMEFFRNSVLKF
jgi:excinuclease ABC subunit C